MATLYSNLKFLKHATHLDAIRDGEVVAPIHIRIKPINRCNHNCWYCAYRTDNLQLGEGIDLDDAIPTGKMFEIIDDVIQMGVKAVTFSGGGEPLIYRPLPECVERLAAGGVKVASLTNGANLKGRVADVFAKHGTWVRVSLDAWDDTSYTAARGVPDGSFTRLVANMRDFLNRDTSCVLGVSFIVTRQNHERIAEVCSLLKDLGVDHVKISGAVVGNDADENNRYHDEISETVTGQIEQAKNLCDDRFQILDHYHELDVLFEKSYSFCPFLQFLTVIGADCNVYSCQDKAYSEAGLLGSIRDRSFKDFWFSDENRDRLYSLDPSRECRHHCVAHHKNLAIHEVLALDPDHEGFV
jgi:MoaA/NifB/PqqE/SkfB family radical SAM enzyme